MLKFMDEGAKVRMVKVVVDCLGLLGSLEDAVQVALSVLGLIKEWRGVLIALKEYEKCLELLTMVSLLLAESGGSQSS